MDSYARRKRIYSMQDKGWHGHRLEEILLCLALVPSLNTALVIFLRFPLFSSIGFPAHFRHLFIQF